MAKKPKHTNEIVIPYHKIDHYKLKLKLKLFIYILQDASLQPLDHSNNGNKS
jgi:hypothetical protein